jgi:hypothetical protein
MGVDPDEVLASRDALTKLRAKAERDRATHSAESAELRKQLRLRQEAAAEANRELGEGGIHPPTEPTFQLSVGTAPSENPYLALFRTTARTRVVMTWEKCRKAAALESPYQDELHSLYEAKFGTSKGLPKLMASQPCLVDPFLLACVHVFLDVYIKDTTTSASESVKIKEALCVLHRTQCDLLRVTPAAVDSIWKEVCRRNVGAIGVQEAYELACLFCEPLQRRFNWE